MISLKSPPVIFYSASILYIDGIRSGRLELVTGRESFGSDVTGVIPERSAGCQARQLVG